MYEVYKETLEVLKKDQNCVIATVVGTKGSTPQKPGAKLLVRQDGSGVGTLGGGCVEGDIWFAAKELLQSGGPAQYKNYFLNEDIAARDGLVCGGTMYFLLDPIKPDAIIEDLEKIVDAYEGGSAIAMASVTKAPRNSSIRTGSRVFIYADSTLSESLGDADIDNALLSVSNDLMVHGKNTILKIGKGIEVFIEAFTTPPQLFLLGGGHISKALADLSIPFGFQVYVVDDRKEFSNKDRFPMAEETIVSSYGNWVNKVSINSNSFIIIATRGHQYDDLATEVAVKTDARYVGLLGSKRKSLMIFEELFRKGISEERIKSVRAPVGLSIGGRTPEEIALSILSEIQMFRFGGDGSPMKMSDRLFKKAKEKALKPQNPVGGFHQALVR
ncbi:MAG: hypothetical protein CL780_06375 [Chloroflexi bacterium]|nr:hypothetical protein [Chloroflexota bacterium]|tara:strand:+ start:4074 stop:5231 length:1158 start_codon:yes stop_codon:yes gene_type:complete